MVDKFEIIIIAAILLGGVWFTTMERSGIKGAEKKGSETPLILSYVWLGKGKESIYVSAHLVDRRCKPHISQWSSSILPTTIGAS